MQGRALPQRPAQPEATAREAINLLEEGSDWGTVSGPNSDAGSGYPQASYNVGVVHQSGSQVELPRTRIQSRGTPAELSTWAPAPIRRLEGLNTGSLTTGKRHLDHFKEGGVAHNVTSEDKPLSQLERALQKVSIVSTEASSYTDTNSEGELAENNKTQLLFNPRLAFIEDSSKLVPISDKDTEGTRSILTDLPEVIRRRSYHSAQGGAKDGKGRTLPSKNDPQSSNLPKYDIIGTGGQSYAWPLRHRNLPPPRRGSDVEDPNRAKEYLPCGHHRGANRDESHCNELVKKLTPFCGHPTLVECSNQMKH
ncbi:hypothetical protein AA313_de0209498 [Arthrobotrys entomopaga]|nr:hypothetical protein AA313_de0209498 [Arthrobotrys entomopaga]